MDELKNVTTENIKDKLYDCLQSTFETIEVVKKDLSQIYEGVANDLDIMRANNSDYTKGVQEGLNGIGCEVEKAYNKGLNDAWELARKVSLDNYEGAYSVKGLKNIFGFNSLQGVFRHYSIQEALAKLEAYEKEQAEIKVGDVVEIKSTKECYVILAIYGKTIWGYSCEGVESPLQELDGVTITKTGKHIDIQSALEQIGGSDV